MIYSIHWFRSRKFEARWAGEPGQPQHIEIRDPRADHPHQRHEWWPVDNQRWNAICRDGLREAFEAWTLVASLAHDRGNGGPPTNPHTLPPFAAAGRPQQNANSPAAQTEESPNA